MKTKRVLLLALLAAGPCLTYAQVNAFANPVSVSINASTENIPLGHTVVSTFELGNNGSDPIPAGGAQWNISFPGLVSVDQASLNMDGGSSIFAATWAINNGTTYLVLRVVGAGIPARVFAGPQTKFVMTVNVTATVIGTLNQQTINNSFDASISQNLNAGDDNASGPLSVSAALPVHLESFTGTRAGGQANLNWAWSNATNFDYFELQRSADGGHFSSLKNKQYRPDGKTATAAFLETDELPAGGDNYYRLRMVDKDASFTYSKIVKLNFTATGAVSVYPNPVKDKANVIGAAAGREISLFDLAGKLLQSQKASGSRTDEVLMTGYANGQYVIKVTGGAVTNTIKIMKQ